jgi:hypothetical protein
MNEFFQVAPKKEQISEKEGKLPSRLLDRVKKVKEYLANIFDDKNKIWFFTILLSMGSISVVEGQNNNLETNKMIDKIRASELSIADATDSIYRSRINDDTFSAIEYFSSKDNKDENVITKISGPSINIEQIGDTIMMGNYMAYEFSVMIANDSQVSNEESKKYEYKEEARSYSAIKPYEGIVNDSNGKEYSSKAFGQTSDEAIINAITELATIIETRVYVVMNQKDEQLTDEKDISFISSYISVLNLETKETILSGVKVIVQKTDDGFTAEAFCK